MNTGGIRADLTVPLARRSHIGDLYTAQPFGNRLTVFTLTGELLRRVLEQQFDVAPGDNPQLLQVSTASSLPTAATRLPENTSSL